MSPEQIAERVTSDNAIALSDSPEHYWPLLIAAIEADRAQRAPRVDPDWEDDAVDMQDCGAVDVAWVAWSASAEPVIMHASDATITGAQAAAMFRAIGATA